MSTDIQQSIDQTMRDLAESRGKLEAIEANWKIQREWNRALTVRLVIQHELSIAKVAEMTGHHRNTVSLWVQLHNAEEKARRSVSK
jgi:predicted HTH domain antitoxin